LEFQQIIQRSCVIGIDGHPFAPLSAGADGVQTDGHPAFQVVANDVFG
jgi:hypothetical protein